MTREEKVKNLLTELIDMIDNGSQRDLDRADEISKTIIKALSQEPCDDAISREDAIKALQKVACYSAAIRARMIGAIEDLPPVTQKSGKWMLNKEKSHFFDVYECSNCGKISGLTNYCPNCGARMTESEEQTNDKS